MKGALFPFKLLCWLYQYYQCFPKLRHKAEAKPYQPKMQTTGVSVVLGMEVLSAVG